jgi:hypothetical protein
MDGDTGVERPCQAPTRRARRPLDRRATCPLSTGLAYCLLGLDSGHSVDAGRLGLSFSKLAAEIIELRAKLVDLGLGNGQKLGQSSDFIRLTDRSLARKVFPGRASLALCRLITCGLAQAA